MSADQTRKEQKEAFKTELGVKKEFYRLLEEMDASLPEDTRLIYRQFRGDPNDSIPRASDSKEVADKKALLQKKRWRPRIWTGIHNVDDDANFHIALASFGKNDRGEFRGKVPSIVAVHGLMVDDLGSSPSSKAPLTAIKRLKPTLLIETSAGNYQAIYLFNEPVRDCYALKQVQKQLIRRNFDGTDPGMDGLNRVCRPDAINGKAKHKDANGDQWRVRIGFADFNNRYTLHEFCRAFGLPMKKPPKVEDYIPPSDEVVAYRHDVFAVCFAALVADGAVYGIPRASLTAKALIDAIDAGDVGEIRRAAHSVRALAESTADQGGWIQITCPWINGGSASEREIKGHGDGVDNGTAIGLPRAGRAIDVDGRDAEGNENWGALRCFHGHDKDTSGKEDAGGKKRNSLRWADILHWANQDGLLSRWEAAQEDFIAEIAADLNKANLLAGAWAGEVA